MILTSRLFGGRVLLPIMEEAEVDELKTLLRTLETNGATLEALTVMLHQIYPMVEEPEEVIELLMKAGILE